MTDQAEKVEYLDQTDFTALVMECNRGMQLIEDAGKEFARIAPGAANSEVEISRFEALVESANDYYSSRLQEAITKLDPLAYYVAHLTWEDFVVERFLTCAGWEASKGYKFVVRLIPNTSEDDPPQEQQDYPQEVVSFTQDLERADT